MKTSTLLTVSAGLVAEIAEYYGSGEYVRTFQSKDLADCVIRHAAAAGVSAMAAGILPGAGSLIATGIGAAAIWTMYIKICKIIKIDLGKNKLKALASAVLTNLATGLAGTIAAMFAASFVPGLSIVVCGAVNFAVVYAAGIVFLNALTHMFHVSRKDIGDIEDIDDKEWLNSVKESAKSMDAKAVVKEAKSVFKEMKQSGELEKVGKSVDINSEDNV